MSNSAYKIYNASAGSGKTFTLTKSYLKLLVQSNNLDRFKTILAITFTNKAVGEMKERIIDMLKLFSSDKSLTEPHPMFEAICNELFISPEKLHSKSKLILKHIVHDYGGFDVSTIDGFTHRIIRTFAYDLNLPVNFEVELDQDQLLNEAVDRLISRAGSDENLTNLLVDFAIEKADDDKSWDISYDFNKIAKLLVNENDITALNTLKNKSLEDFKALKKQLASQIKTIENLIVETAEATLNLINECGLQHDDFNRKSLPNHFEKLQRKDYNVSFDSNWQTDLIEGNTLYPKRVTEFIASTIESIQPNLSDAFTKTKALIYEVKFKKAVYRNITPLSVLNAIQKELDTLKEEQNKMLISEFNKIISNEIKNQPTPFIYERLGEKFKHYFIDEFQDTSTLQWQNLVPLLDNALSSANGTTMLVGDAKQAIYRWRGGEAEQFIDLYNKTVNPFHVEPNVLALETNYRSSKEIIDFNNSFFKFLSERYFSLDDYADLYQNSSQNKHTDYEGYVNLQFLDIQKEDDAAELYASQTLETIQHCLDNDYALSDICVLVRKKKEGVQIANYLTEKGVKITSSETLLLKNSDKVDFLSNFLKLLIQPNNDELKIELLSFLAKQHQVEDQHLFFESYLKKNLSSFLEGFKDLNIFLNKEKLLQQPLYELVEDLVRRFQLNKESDAYVQFYLDIVLEFTQKKNSDLVDFVTYFENKKDALSIVSPNNTNAVEIMTIHKSKGLEFPIVIFPFAELDIYRELDPKIWFPVNKDDYNGFETLLINYNKDVEQFGEAGREIYQNRQSKLELDNINLLYVALTRAEKQLFIISKKDISTKGVVKDNTFSGMFISYLKEEDLWNDNQLIYTFGKAEKNSLKTEATDSLNSITLISVPKENHNLRIITKEGLLWDTKQEQAIERGNLVHLILSKVRTNQDIDYAMEEVLMSGDIQSEQLETLKKLVSQVIGHPNLSAYFNDKYTIYMEQDIVTNYGEIIRPDRLNINSKQEVVIIDYKTGAHKPSYVKQLERYELILNQMNLSVTKKILVYINDSVDVIEV